MIVASVNKQKAIGVITLLIIFTILGSLLIFDRPQNSELTAYEAQSQKVFEDAKNQFERIRNVTLPSDISLFVYTKQQAIDRWGKDSSGLGESNILRQEIIYKSLFLMEEHESLDGAIVDWISSWTAVSVGNEIYVIYENFWPWDLLAAEAVLIHELTHVWQSSLPTPTSYDVNRAYTALIEGDAVYMADYYKSNYSNSSFSSNNNHHNLFALLDFSHLNSVSPKISDTVAELNLFPYTKGKLFVSALIDNGGWDMLNQCYLPAYVPSSTAQILHPDKYFAGETATFVFTPAPADNVWISVPNNYGYLSDTYGEYFIYVMLSRWLSDNQAQEVAAGWVGDNFSYYEANCDFLFVWNIAWNSIQDAAKFTHAFSDMLNYTQAVPQDATSWYTNSRHLTIIWDANTKSTLIICSNNQSAINSLLLSTS